MTISIASILILSNMCTHTEKAVQVVCLLNSLRRKFQCMYLIVIDKEQILLNYDRLTNNP